MELFFVIAALALLAAVTFLAVMHIERKRCKRIEAQFMAQEERQLRTRIDLSRAAWESASAAAWSARESAIQNQIDLRQQNISRRPSQAYVKHEEERRRDDRDAFDLTTPLNPASPLWVGHTQPSATFFYDCPAPSPSYDAPSPSSSYDSSSSCDSGSSSSSD